jgi:hypothetical protein
MTVESILDVTTTAAETVADEVTRERPDWGEVLRLARIVGAGALLLDQCERRRRRKRSRRKTMTTI